MNIFLEHLSAAYPDDYIALVCDGAAWHKSGSLQIAPNIELLFIPPYTPEMNPIEQIWKELRARGFHNEVFQTLEKVVDRLCDTIRSLTCETIRSKIRVLYEIHSDAVKAARALRDYVKKEART
mgnify:CR=1 FL=1